MKRRICGHSRSLRHRNKQLCKGTWLTASSQSCHPWQRRMHSSAACADQVHSPAAACEPCSMHSSIGTLKWAGICCLKNALPVGDLESGSSSNMFPWAHTSLPQTASRSVQPSFLHRSPVYPTHTDTQTTLPIALRPIPPTLHLTLRAFDWHMGTPGCRLTYAFSTLCVYVTDCKSDISP